MRTLYKLKAKWTKELMIEKVKTDFKEKSQIFKPYKGRAAHQSRYKEGDNKCSIGIFIPKELYCEEMEGNNVERLLKKFPKLKKFMPLEMGGLTALQELHDRNIEDLPEKIIEFIEQNTY